MASLTLTSSTTMPMARQALITFTNPFRKYTIPTILFTHISPKRHRFSCQYTHSLSAISDPKPCIRSPEAIALEYSDLNLPHTTSEEVGHVRIRQHVNPLSSSFATPAEVPNWNEVFEDTKLPLMVDIGSGYSLFGDSLINETCKFCDSSVYSSIMLNGTRTVEADTKVDLKWRCGRFLMWLAKRNLHSKNYLGLEIRKKLAMRAEDWAKELSLRNLHYMFANATISFKQLVSAYPGPLMLVSILCPDPHFKKKHHKRRVLQKPLVDSIVNCLAPGGQVFIQSDVLEVALDMRNHFDAESDTLAHVNNIDSSVVCDDEGWLLRNPMGIRTEREIHAELEGAKIYRRMYQKRE